MSDDNIRDEAERLATPTKDRARAVLLASALQQAVHTIEFLHGCLTSPNYKYAYPEQTEERLAAMRLLLDKVKLVPDATGCVHSHFQPLCAQCQSALEHRRILAQAESVLSSSYDSERPEESETDQAAVRACPQDRASDSGALPEEHGHCGG